MATIFDPIKLGDIELKNRIIMAPLTRCRADAGRVPNALMAEYYVQRASAGLILSEATSVTPMGVGYPDTPGIWSNDQVRGWSQRHQGDPRRWRQDLPATVARGPDLPPVVPERRNPGGAQRDPTQGPREPGASAGRLPDPTRTGNR